MAYRTGAGYQNKSYGGGLTATWTLIGIVVGGFLLTYAFPQLIEQLIPTMQTPWGILTYPMVALGGWELLYTVLSALWLYFCAGWLELKLGTRSLLIHALVFTVFFGVCAIALQQANLGDMYPGPFMLVAALTVLMAAYVPEMVIRLCGILPIKMLYIGLLSTAMVFFYNGDINRIGGILLTIPIGLIWLYGMGKLHVPSPKKQTERAKNRDFDQFYSKVRTREKEREEREKLRKLFESSYGENDDDTSAR